MDAIIIENLEKIYPGGVHALKGVNLKIKEGDFFGFLGPNGAGKTTTVQILSHLISKSGGKVSVCGADLDRDPLGIKKLLGVVPQEFNFAYFECLEDILIKQAAFYGVPRKVAKERAIELLERLGLSSKRREAAFRLSGGMKRRLMVARALVHRPKILILDEPTAGVDVEMRRSLWGFLQELSREGTTIILTTHYLEEAEYLCNRIGLIDDGRLVGTYSVSELGEHLDFEEFILTCRGKKKLSDRFGAKWLGADLEVVVKKEESINELFSWLTEEGVEVLSMKQKMGRLESLITNVLETSCTDTPTPQ